jgi:CBS domain-containing protein
MRRNVATIDLAQSVDDAVALMRANACRRIPLTENGHAVGIVTLAGSFRKCDRCSPVC